MPPRLCIRPTHLPLHTSPIPLNFVEDEQLVMCTEVHPAHKMVQEVGAIAILVSAQVRAGRSVLLQTQADLH